MDFSVLSAVENSNQHRCVMGKIINPADYIDKKYNSWTIKKYVGFHTDGIARIFEAECKCGNVCHVHLQNLIREQSTQCVKCSHKQLALLNIKSNINRQFKTWIVKKEDNSSIFLKCLYCNNTKQLHRRAIYRHISACECSIHLYKEPSVKDKVREKLIEMGQDEKEVDKRLNSISKQRIHQLYIKIVNNNYQPNYELSKSDIKIFLEKNNNYLTIKDLINNLNCSENRIRRWLANHSNNILKRRNKVKRRMEYKLRK